MNATTTRIGAAFALVLTATTVVLSQDVGSRRGGAHTPSPGSPDREAIADYVEIQGSAEVRLAPTEARIVLGFFSEGEDAQTCRAGNDATIGSVRAALLELGVTAGDVRRDFIAITPRYTWSEEDLSGERALVERRTGYRLDENLHVHVRDLAELPAVRAAALDSGASELIAFEYGAPGLDEARGRATALALEAARAKAGLLLGQAFGGNLPAPVNVREQIAVHAPADLYESYTATGPGQGPYTTSGRMPRIAAPRPLTTFYRGFDQDVDVRGGGLALDNEFSVVARVWCYYGAPGRERMVPGTGR